jgi:hypothetical protein
MRQAPPSAQHPPFAASYPARPRPFPFFGFPVVGPAISLFRLLIPFPLFPAPGEDIDASVITASSVITVYFDYSILLPFLEDLGSEIAECLSTRAIELSFDFVYFLDPNDSTTFGRPLGSSS